MLCQAQVCVGKINNATENKKSGSKELLNICSNEANWPIQAAGNWYELLGAPTAPGKARGQARSERYARQI